MAVTLSISMLQESQDKTEATSMVRVIVSAVSTNGSYNNNNVGGTVYFSGSEVYYNLTGTSVYTKVSSLSFEHSFAANTSTPLCNYLVKVRHGSNGMASITVNAEYFSGTASGKVTASRTLTLTKIDRPTVVTMSDATGGKIGAVTRLGLTRFSDSYTHSLSAVFKSDNDRSWTYNLGTFSSVGAVDYVNWTIPTGVLSYMPDAETCTVTVTCTTFNGSITVGTTTVSFTCYIDSASVPVFTSSSITDANGYYNTYGVFVENQSELVVNAVATPTTGATIAKYEASLEGLYVSATSTPMTLGTPNTSGNKDVRIRATDTRGRTILGTKAIVVAPYSGPTLQIEAKRTNSSGTETDEGTYIKVRATGSTENINNKGTNTGTIVMRYKRDGSSSWTSQTYSGGVTYDHTFTITGASASYIYNIEVTVTDKIGTKTTRTTDAGTAQPILDFKAGGKGIGILSVSDVEGIKTGGDFYMRPGNEMFGGGTLDFYFDENSQATQIAQVDSTGMSSISRVNINFKVPTNLPYPIMSSMYVGSPSSMTLVANIDRNRGFQFLYPISSSDADLPSIAIDELTWSSLISGDVGKQLWSGTWNAGSITVTGANKYRVFLFVTNSSTGEPCIALRSSTGNRIYCFNNSCTTDNTLYLNAGSFTISGNTISRTMPRFWGFSGSSISPNNIMYIYKIVGLL